MKNGRLFVSLNNGFILPLYSHRHVAIFCPVFFQEEKAV